MGVELAKSLPSEIDRLLVIIKGTAAPCYLTDDIPVKYLSPIRSIRNYAYYTFPMVVMRYIKLIFNYRPDVVLSILPLDNVLNLIFSKLLGYKAIISAHSMLSDSNNSQLLSLIIRTEQLFLKKTQAVQVAVSYSVKKDIEDYFGTPGEKIKVIYNPLEIDKIVNLSLEPVIDINFNIPTIITVGRLNAVKGQWHLIRTFSEVRKKHECKLLLCGEGAEKEYLEGLVKDLGIEDDVVFLGWRENPYKYMSKSDVFVLPSLSESFGNVLVEAMASGCPVVAANYSDAVWEIVGENEEFGLVAGKMSGVKHSAGEVLDDGELSLKMKIERLLEDGTLRDELSDIGVERAKAFSLERGIQKYTNIIFQKLEDKI